MPSSALLFLTILFLMSVANVLVVYSIFGYDVDHSEDILFIVCLNLLIWAGVAMLCAVLEYNVRVRLFVSNLMYKPLWLLFEYHMEQMD